MESSDKKKDSKNRYMSPSFRKGAVKDKKEDEEDFKIALMQVDVDESMSPSPKKEHKKGGGRRSVQIEQMPSKMKMNEGAGLASVKEGEDGGEKEIETNALKEGRVKKIGTLSQAGKGEDGFTKVNQDSFLVIKNKINDHNLPDFNIFSVMDGHGMNGHLVSRYLTQYFKNYFGSSKKFRDFKTENGVCYRLKKDNCSIIRRLMKHAEKDISKSDIDANFSGTTCVMVFQVGEKLICANVGDSRAILVKKNGIVELSIDQKPNDPKEQKRIEAAGGEVSQYEEDGEKSGPFRVWKKGEMYPGIAMSRSIGDLIASTLGVVPEPEFIEATLDSDAQFMVLASDGVWEFLENKKVAELVMPYYKKNDPDGACQTLIKESTKWWNQEDIVVDDITAIVVFF